MPGMLLYRQCKVLTHARELVVVPFLGGRLLVADRFVAGKLARGTDRDSRVPPLPPPPTSPRACRW
eukprot:364899-Chlamydomonas_euryale.AAC.38